MPTTANGLWAEIIDFENLYVAFEEARAGKRYRREVMQFASQLEENLINLQNHLIWKSWEPGKPREFVVLEPKRRAIQAPPFIDRVLHHAMVRVVGPHFERRFIPDSFACREGKGVQRCVARTQQFLRAALREYGPAVYVLKADISRYFASIRHDILMTQVERVVSDPDVLWLWRKVVGGYGHDDGVGLPVGALTSQLGANILLDRLDHVAKDDLGIRFYTRYMDDFVAILPDKAAAQRMMRTLGEVVNSLGLVLNPKTAIHPWQRGIDFCGYRTWPTHVLPRKRNIKRAKANFRELAARYHRGEIELEHVRRRVASFLAYAKHCNARTTVSGVLADLILIPGARPGSMASG